MTHCSTWWLNYSDVVAGQERLNGPVVRYVLRENPPPWVVKMYVTRVQFPVEPFFVGKDRVRATQ